MEIEGSAIARSIAHVVDAASGRGHFVAVGNNHQRGHLTHMKVFEKLQDILGISPIQVPCWFVGEQECRGVHECSGDRGALHLAPTQLVRKVRGAVGNASEFHGSLGGSSGFGQGLALELQRQRDVFENGQRREKIEKLEYNADILTPVACPIGLIHGMQRLVAYMDFAAGGHVQSAQQMQQGALAAPAFSCDCDKCALFYTECGITQGVHGLLALIRVGTPDVFQVDKHIEWLARLQALRSDFFHDPDFAVLDETEDYIVVNKPAHLLVHPSKPGNPPTLLDGLEGLLAFDIANGARLSIINRLDRDTSGIVLIAKNPQAARLFCIAMERRQFKKGYQAIVFGWPERDTFEVDAPLLRKGEITPSTIWLKQMMHPDGAASFTRFRVLQRLERDSQKFALIEATPVTGRMHQIRVHLQHTGHSIVGDKIYGPSEGWYLKFIDDGWSDEMEHALLMKRHALHAFTLSLPGHDLHWEAPLPRDMMTFLEMARKGSG